MEEDEAHELPFLDASVSRPKANIHLHRHRYMRSKVPLNATGKFEVVYKINCANCETNRIDETGKKLAKRLREHWCAIKRNKERY